MHFELEIPNFNLCLVSKAIKGIFVYLGTPKPVSVWVGDGRCQQVYNPYLTGTASLEDVLRMDVCYITKPYICQKPEKTGI